MFRAPNFPSLLLCRLPSRNIYLECGRGERTLALKCAIHLTLCRILPPPFEQRCVCLHVCILSLSLPYCSDLPPASVLFPFPLVITFITGIGCPHISYIFPHVQWPLPCQGGARNMERGQRGRGENKKPSRLAGTLLLLRVIDVCAAGLPRMSTNLSELVTPTLLLLNSSLERLAAPWGVTENIREGESNSIFHRARALGRPNDLAAADCFDL